MLASRLRHCHQCLLHISESMLAPQLSSPFPLPHTHSPYHPAISATFPLWLVIFLPSCLPPPSLPLPSVLPVSPPLLCSCCPLAKFQAAGHTPLTASSRSRFLQMPLAILSFVSTIKAPPGTILAGVLVSQRQTELCVPDAQIQICLHRVTLKSLL